MTRKLILLALAFVLFTACGNLPSPAKPASQFPVIQVTPAVMQQQNQVPVVTGEASQATAMPTPDTSAENVVRQLLSAYEKDPATMTQFMTPRLQSQVPADGPRALLQASGPLQSYIIRAGRISPHLTSAEVEVAMVVDEVEITRGFILVKQGDTWLVDRIDFKNN